MNGPYASGSDAAASSTWVCEGRVAGQMAVSNLQDLQRACDGAGVELGTFDLHIIRWLATFEPSCVAVIAGLITRAGLTAPRGQVITGEDSR